MNAEFQRIARRDKKAILSDQSKETEENNRMGKTRGLFKKIRDTKGIFHAKMGTVKDRNGMDLTEAEDIKKRWQEYTEELYNKDLHDPDNHDGVIIHLGPDILECEVKWALGSITMNKAIVELFQILKDDAVHTLPTLNVPTVSFWHVGFHIPAGLGLISWWHAKHNFFWMKKIKLPFAPAEPSKVFWLNMHATSIIMDSIFEVPSIHQNFLVTPKSVFAVLLGIICAHVHEGKSLEFSKVHSQMRLNKAVLWLPSVFSRR